MGGKCIKPRTLKTLNGLTFSYHECEGMDDYDDIIVRNLNKFGSRDNPILWNEVDKVIKWLTKAKEHYGR